MTAASERTAAFGVPVLLLIFNRPSTTRRVFEAIQKVRPARLFIAADGPRPDRLDDVALCSEARAIVSGIDWPCHVETLFREKNVGLRAAVSGAIDWFFSNVDEGIVLEDDTVPDEEFFTFCEELLKRYRDMPQVMMIAGSNPAQGRLQFTESYAFCSYALIWGWATWRRAWTAYDVGLRNWPSGEAAAALEAFPGGGAHFRHMWAMIFDAIKSGKETWDYQWVFAVMARRGCVAIPSSSLVENIGFGTDATHTTGIPPPWMRRAGKAPFNGAQLQHPPVVRVDVDLNRVVGKEVFGLTMWASVKFKIKLLLKTLGLWQARSQA